MPVQVKLFSTLVKISRTGQATFALAWRDGLTAGAVLRGEFSERDAEAIAIVVNGEQADAGRALHDGDTVEFLVNLAGGA